MAQPKRKTQQEKNRTNQKKKSNLYSGKTKRKSK